MENAMSSIKKILLTLYNRHVKGGRLIFKIIFYAVMTVVGFVFVFPFLYMIITSVKSPEDLYNSTVNWIPTSLYFDNYVSAYKWLSFFKHFTISVVTTLTGVVLHCFVDSYIAYGLARYKFYGKKLLFFLVIFSIVVPTQVIILPQFIQFSTYKWQNSYLPMIIPLFFGMGLRSGVFIFLFHQFFQGLPKSLEEAAKIDGCNYFSVFFRIVLPTAKTAVFVCLVLSLVWHWNDYYAPAIYLNSMESWPLPSMLPRIFDKFKVQTGQQGGFYNISDMGVRDVTKIVTEGTVMAATFIVVLPVLVSYAFLQTRFLEGIERTGLVE